MLDTPAFISEGADKPRSSHRKESSSFKSGAELGAALATAGEQVESERKKKLSLEERNKQALEKHRQAMERLDERNAKIWQNRDKSKEKAPEEDYESYEVSVEKPVTKTSEQAPVASGEIHSGYKLNKQETNKHVISRDSKESRSDDARTDYIKAYKEYDPRFTKNKSDDLIAKTKPPFFAFGKAARELKRLYGVMVRAEDSKIGGLSPENRQAIAESGQWDEDMEAEQMKHAPINK